MTRKELESWATHGIYRIDCNSPIKDFADEIGFNHGVYGWNWTAYNAFNGVFFIEGYRSFPAKTVISSSFVQNVERDLKAQKKLYNDGLISYDNYLENGIEILSKYCIG